MRLILLSIAMTLPMGCAIQSWPPAMAIGNAGLCKEFVVEYDPETGNPTLERWSGCQLFGGPLSDQGRELVEGTMSTTRAAAGAVIGVP